MRELVLYIAQRAGNDPTFGRVKLAKLLYYSDCEAFRRLGTAITGADYQKLPHGPAARQYVPVFLEMQADGVAHEQKTGLGYKVIADAEPDITVFSQEEIAIVDEIVDKYQGWTAERISRESHKEIGWRVAELGAVIPYSAYLLEPAVAPEHIKRAQELVAANNWVSEPF
jgi:hypothetical protein